MKNMYKSIYDHISLSKTQKAEIWNNITQAAENESVSFTAPARKRHMPLRAAACAALLTCSGMAVFASVNPRVDRIADSMMFFNPDQESATAEQKAIYAQYIAEDAFILNDAKGKFVIDGIMYDQSIICMPYTYYPNTPLGEPGTQTETTRQLRLNSGIYFRTQDKTRKPDDYSFLSVFGQQDPVIQADGTLKGSFIVYQDLDRFKTGDVIECCLFPRDHFRKIRELTQEECDTIICEDNHVILAQNDRYYEAEVIPPEVLHTFTLASAVENLDFIAEPITLTDNFVLDCATLSSLSLNLNTHYEWDLTDLSYEEYNSNPALTALRERTFQTVSQSCIVMKDGSIVSFTSQSCAHNYDLGKSWTAGFTLLLVEPIRLEDAQWLRIPSDTGAKGDDAYIWIPLH